MKLLVHKSTTRVFNDFFFSLCLVDDASGHYTTGFFWGNNYWTGSMTLCRSIYNTDSDDFFPKKPSSNLGLTFIDGLGADSQLRHENPPFFPRFGVLKVVFNETHTTPVVKALLYLGQRRCWLFKFQPRTIHIGVCLPSSCEKEDVYIIAEAAGRKLETKHVEVRDIRIPNADGFSLWNDFTFIVML